MIGHETKGMEKENNGKPTECVNKKKEWKKSERKKTNNGRLLKVKETDVKRGQ